MKFMLISGLLDMDFSDSGPKPSSMGPMDIEFNLNEVTQSTPFMTPDLKEVTQSTPFMTPDTSVLNTPPRVMEEETESEVTDLKKQIDYLQQKLFSAQKKLKERESTSRQYQENVSYRQGVSSRVC